MGAVEQVLGPGARVSGLTLAVAPAEHSSLPEALDAWYRRRRDCTLSVADTSPALLRQGSGGELSARETELRQLGIPGPQARIAAEAC